MTAPLTAIEVFASTIPERPPVDVDRLAADLGLAVIRRADMPREIAGMISRDKSLGSRSGYTIHINANDNRRRQRFTLAHEIAHYMMHRDLIGDGVTDDALYRSKLGDFHERQANRMAADILMPPKLVRSMYRQTPSIAQLAHAFDVSADAMSIRVRELRLGP